MIFFLLLIIWLGTTRAFVNWKRLGIPKLILAKVIGRHAQIRIVRLATKYRNFHPDLM